MSYAILCGSILLGSGIIDMVLLCDYLIRDLVMGISMTNAAIAHFTIDGVILIGFILLGTALIRVRRGQRR
jgi:hypothetical protein